MAQKLHHKIKRVIRAPDFFQILILRTVGNFLVLSSLFMIGKTFYQPVKEEARFFINQYFGRTYVVADSPQSSASEQTDDTNNRPQGLLASALNIKQVEVLSPQDPNFSLIIPKIGADAKIVNNVNTSDDRVYLDALKHGVAHAEGTAYPGEGGHIFLFAHSTDYIWNIGSYNAIFYLLYKLQKGDDINIYYKGKRHVYKMIDSKIVDPSEVEYLTRKTNKEFLTLQTCWPPGTSLKRLLVFAVPVSE